MSSSFDVSTVVFWVVLGGLIFTATIIMVIVYIVCYSRNPGNCFSKNPIDELLEIPRQKQDTTQNATNGTNSQIGSVISTPETSRANSNHQVARQHLSNIVFKNIQETRKICVTPRENSPEEPCSASLDRVKLVANDKRKQINLLKKPENRPSPSCSPRNLHVTSIASVR